MHFIHASQVREMVLAAENEMVSMVESKVRRHDGSASPIAKQKRMTATAKTNGGLQIIRKGMQHGRSGTGNRQSPARRVSTKNAGKTTEITTVTHLQTHPTLVSALEAAISMANGIRERNL